MNAVTNAHALVDKMMDGVRRETAAQGWPIRCAGAGCFWCCKERLLTERREAVHMLEIVSEEERPMVIAGTERWWQLFFDNDHHKAPAILEAEGDPEMMKYLNNNLWCPLLRDGKCSVYDRRPVGCRAHVAIGHPKRCELPSKRPKQRFVSAVDMEDVNTQAMLVMIEGEPAPKLQFDHLGIWLGHLLLGKTERSRAAMDMETQ